MSTDPGFGTAFTVTDLNAAIDFKFPVAPVLFVQSSRNIGSAGLVGTADAQLLGSGLLLLGVQRAPAPPGLSGAIRNDGPLVASMPLAPKR